jgi:hypothetical protein
MNHAHFKVRIRTREDGAEGRITGTLALQYLTGSDPDGAAAATTALPYEAAGRAADTIRTRGAESYLLVEGALRVEPPSEGAPNHRVSLRIFSAAPLEPLPVKAVAMAA